MRSSLAWRDETACCQNRRLSWRHHSPPRPCRGSVTATIGFAALLPSTWTCHRTKRCNSAASSRPEQGVQALAAPPLRPPGYLFRSLARFASSASPVPTPYGAAKLKALNKAPSPSSAQETARGPPSCCSSGMRQHSCPWRSPRGLCLVGKLLASRDA